MQQRQEEATAAIVATASLFSSAVADPLRSFRDTMGVVAEATTDNNGHASPTLSTWYDDDVGGGQHQHQHHHHGGDDANNNNGFPFPPHSPLLPLGLLPRSLLMELYH